MQECLGLLEDPETNDSAYLAWTRSNETPTHGTKALVATEDDFAPRFKLRSGLSIYMFSTTAPCGDASMELLISSKAPEQAIPWADENLHAELERGAPLGRGHFSLLGAVRRKPARGDAAVTMCKSCSDKIALKQAVGILSFPTDLLVRTDCSSFLTGLVVYNDQCNEVGYSRAFGPKGRMAFVEELGGRHFVTHALPTGMKRFKYDKCPSFGNKTTNLAALSIAGYSNAKAPPRLNEVLVNGVKQGYRQYDDGPGKGSAVSRSKMVEQYLQICSLLRARGAFTEGITATIAAQSYQSLKNWPMREHRKSIKAASVARMGGWVTNSSEDDFTLYDLAVADT